MNVWYFVRDFLACGAAVLFYGVLMSMPKRPLFLAALTGASSYFIYRLIFLYGKHEMLGYLIATLFAAIAAELLARRCKMPVTIFVLPGIIPLVPGVGLYRSMLCLVQNDLNGFLNEGVRTLFISGIIAVTVAVINASARNFFRRGGEEKSRFHSMRQQ